MCPASEKPIGEERRYGEGELAMKCPNCGAENPEGKMFCGDCGTGLPQPPPPPPVQPMQPVYARPTPSWIRSNWKGLVSVVVVVLVILSAVGLIYSQPWSKVQLSIYNRDTLNDITLMVEIDGKYKLYTTLGPTGGVSELWSVPTGSHSVTIAYYYPNYESQMTHGWSGDVQVGPLSTKNVDAYLGPK